jgi:hypothetical protein
MNKRLHIAGSFQTMRDAVDDADREFIENTDARKHSESLQRLGRVLMNSIAEIIATDGGDDGYLYEADGIATDIAHGYSDLIEEAAEEPDHTPDQDGNGTHNHRQQFGGGL